MLKAISLVSGMTLKVFTMFIFQDLLGRDLAALKCAQTLYPLNAMVSGVLKVSFITLLLF